MSDTSSIFRQLMATIEDRKANPPVKSYTTSLFQGGVTKIGAKITEEAAELIEAAAQGDERPEPAVDRGNLVHEAADLLYHVFVLLVHRGVSLDEVEQKLADRFGISGLDEKESRGKKLG